MRDDHHRRASGKLDQHRQKSKASKRKRDKLKSRLLQLERDQIYSSKEKKSIRRALTSDTMSPEVTDDEEDSRRVAMPFAWESSRLKEVKRVLDTDYRKALSAQSRRNHL
ncbi:uncharacterized protein LOC125676469 [Ostrea edulis]|uniref:uncharacterized protein LOC125676469 n=1 Tax=Ostrea edulis TaxID=37623 RepID=UPI0024AF5C12|nr:uncharacterized protein LOC125676469 [Ostrea edulis]